MTIYSKYPRVYKYLSWMIEINCNISFSVLVIPNGIVKILKTIQPLINISKIKNIHKKLYNQKFYTKKVILMWIVLLKLF